MSSTAQKHAFVTREEYLAFEDAADTRHEYVNGQVYAMAGARLPHATIVGNLSFSLQSQVRGSGCRVLTNDMRVKVPETGDYLYPDLVVVCGTPELEEAVFDTLLNPLLIIEVLSHSTKDYDRGEKWEKYRQVETLRDYAVLAQDRPHVERYSRQNDRLWLFSETTQITASIPLESLGCTLALSDIYHNVPGAGPGDAAPGDAADG